MPEPLTRYDCAALDAADPLHALRGLFTIPSGVNYLDGNSLGVMPAAAPARAAAVVQQEWGEGLIRSWNTANWVNLPQRVGDKIGRLIGAPPGQTLAGDSTSVNLYKVLAAALLLVKQQGDPARRVIVSERSNFPTDLYIAEALARERGFELVLAEAEDLPGLLDARFGPGGVAPGALAQGPSAIELRTRPHPGERPRRHHRCLLRRCWCPLRRSSCSHRQRCCGSAGFRSR